MKICDIRFLLTIFLIIAAFGICTGRASAQTAVTGRSLVVDLAADHVDITLGFNGADLTLFGVKDKPGQVAVVIRGPEQTTVVRRKSKALGIWMNTRAVEFLNVPVYYDFATSAPEPDLASPETLNKLGIGLDALDFHVEKNEDREMIDSFREALVRNRQGGGHFPLSPRTVKFISDDFFRVDFHVPADVPTGNYLVETLLLNEGKVIDRRETSLRVAQVGFSADVYNFSYERPFFYALLSVGMAIVLGAGSHFAFRR
ncbi:MAG: TIGR02186 family protein [Micavibrio aeruginosavorus]|uniref:TIGR02186 family protein n=1 Tax=Micavibrio aeruginosavorus TaxID=349221 RepID=A0A7T5UGC2_9BACT|nr:MAG: TIGR02186 family protein [Micavibrio aeruginosavorus]